MKSLEAQLHEKEKELFELRKTVARTAVTQELSESGLPAAAQDRIRKKFQTANKTDGIKEAIIEEREYIRAVRASGWKNKGAAASESARVELVDSYKRLGLTEKEAAIAAGVESAVEDISESRRQLRDAAKLLGLSDKEAEDFAKL